MLLTHTSRKLRNPDSFPTTQLFILGTPEILVVVFLEISLTHPPSNMPPRRTCRSRIMVSAPLLVALLDIWTDL